MIHTFHKSYKVVNKKRTPIEFYVCLILVSAVALVMWLNVSIIKNIVNPDSQQQQQQVSSANLKGTFSTDINLSSSSSNINKRINNPKQNSKFAYVTLISGIDKSQKYRGFLYNAMIMKKSLAKLGSTADFIALIGFSDAGDTKQYESDLDLLRDHGIIVFYLPRFLDKNTKLTFAEMALLKITPWSFTQYDRIQFLDGDVMPTRNMDCFFQLSANAFTVGAASPLNSGWYLAIPDQRVHEYLKARSLWRLKCDWDEERGWLERLTDFDLTFRGGGRPVSKWGFNGADMDQGLLTHYYLLNHGNALLIDTDSHIVRKFDAGLKHQPDTKLKMKDVLEKCDGIVPTSFYAHFTGRSKPWIVDKEGQPGSKKKSKQPSPNMVLWMELLDQLGLPVNSSNAKDLGLGSPLGYFNTDMYKKKTEKCVVPSDHDPIY